jgi:hypothetical protein
VALFCRAHKRDGDIIVAPKLCQGLGCSTHASFGAPGTKRRLYCAKHKRADDVNLVTRQVTALDSAKFACVQKNAFVGSSFDLLPGGEVDFS